MYVHDYSIKGTTLLSSDGLHSVVAYGAVLVVLTGIFSRNHRRQLNEFVGKLEQESRVKVKLPRARLYVTLLYLLLTLLVVHSACLVFTTSVLQQRIANDSETAAAANKSSTLAEKGGNDAEGYGSMDDISDNSEHDNMMHDGDMPMDTGHEPHHNDHGNDESNDPEEKNDKGGDEGAEAVKETEVDVEEDADMEDGGDENENFEQFRRRKRQIVPRHPDDFVELEHLHRSDQIIEMTIKADKIEENYVEREDVAPGNSRTKKAHSKIMVSTRLN